MKDLTLVVLMAGLLATQLFILYLQLTNKLTRHHLSDIRDRVFGKPAKVPVVPERRIKLNSLMTLVREVKPLMTVSHVHLEDYMLCPNMELFLIVPNDPDDAYVRAFVGGEILFDTKDRINTISGSVYNREPSEVSYSAINALVVKYGVSGNLRNYLMAVAKAGTDFMHIKELMGLVVKTNMFERDYLKILSRGNFRSAKFSKCDRSEGTDELGTLCLTCSDGLEYNLRLTTETTLKVGDIVLNLKYIHLETD